MPENPTSRALCDSHGCEGVHEHRNRYCGSKFAHPPHTGPMIGNETVWFDCRGKDHATK